MTFQLSQWDMEGEGKITTKKKKEKREKEKEKEKEKGEGGREWKRNKWNYFLLSFDHYVVLLSECVDGLIVDQ